MGFDFCKQYETLFKVIYVYHYCCTLTEKLEQEIMNEIKQHQLKSGSQGNNSTPMFYLVSSNDAIFILEISTSECALAMTQISLFFRTFEVFQITTI